MSKVYFIMGVSGSGKTTVGSALAELWQIPFFDGDDFHPEKNIQKMASGQSLTDEDRIPWLTAIRTFARSKLYESSLIIACSALKESYRQILSDGIEEHVQFIHLDGSYDLIMERIKQRNHFMPASLLQSQLETLEQPSDAICVDIVLSPGEIADAIAYLASPAASYITGIVLPVHGGMPPGI